MTKKGIDISAWQDKTSVDVFKKNKASIPCVILRSSVTRWKDKLTIEKDKQFENSIKCAHKAGMQIGIYHYSQAKNEAEAIKEAEFMLKIIKPHKDKITLPVAFDWEFGGRLTSHVAGKNGKEKNKKICDAFCKKVKDAGFTPMVYANLSTFNAYIASDIYKYYPIWVAQYYKKCSYKHEIWAWQYTSSGRVSGLPGRIDMNYIYGKVYGHTATEERPKARYTGELPKLPHRGWFSSGDKGAEVKKLQKFLNAYGDYDLDVDGEVGRQTIYAVRQYQGREKLKVDGAFGKECLNRAKTVLI